MMRDLTSNGVITFDHIWTIFPADIDVFAHEDGQDRFYRCVKGYSSVRSGQFGMERCFRIDCLSVDSNGEKLQYRNEASKIGEFKGLVDVTSLDVFPAHLHPQASQVLAGLQSRGQAFEKLKGIHHVQYSGFFIYSKGRKRFVSPTVPMACLGDIILTR